MQKFILILAGIALVATVIAKLDIPSLIRKSWERGVREIKAELGQEEVEKVANEAREGLKSLFWNQLWHLVVGVLVMQRLWRWRLAPDGSFQKTVWTIALMATIAFGLYVVVAALDNWLNRSEKKLPNYRSISGDSKS